MDTRPCIWMDAKAVEYQLCPLKGNCDACEFHQKMVLGCQSHSTRVGSALMNIRDPDEALIEFHPGLQYLPGHFWYRRTGMGKIRIGVDGFIWQLFPSTTQVLLPSVETEVLENQCFSWLLIEGAIIYVKAPFKGRVTATNPLFTKTAALNPQLFLSPNSDLWFIEIACEDSIIKALDSLTHKDFYKITQADQSLLKRMTATQAMEGVFSLSRISQLTKQQLSEYLRKVSDGRILIC